ncbi:unnamed protein product [Menidia menidia]|uniref:(Atlantic silverside) hypothetical protein n=1 Tax=Menidia menidia TaxID=238744 RepID=A0A8S4BCF6_9TELE|nr:unnamed protein product [Menidia menidia]
MAIPVVDFGACSLAQERAEERVEGEQLRALSEELRAAFTQVGFVFLKNSGITQDEVERVMDMSRRFFLLPEELKKPFSRGSFANNLNHGWVSLEAERLNPSRPGDLKESFNTSSFHPDIVTILFLSTDFTKAEVPDQHSLNSGSMAPLSVQLWPCSGSLAGFQETHASFFQRCRELSLRVLRLLAHGLGLEPDLFLRAHGLIGSDQNGSTLRSLYYPPVSRRPVKEGQLRCGEHSDYGSITLLFQSCDGLQVCNHSGEFISAPTIPGAVLVNIADLMQRWTSDRLVSVRHRVLLPPAGDAGTRQALAFFVQPDDQALVSCCDGSSKYPPVKAGAYLSERFRESYGQS